MKLFFVWHLGERSNCQRQTEDGGKIMQLNFVAESESRVSSCAVMCRRAAHDTVLGLPRYDVNVYPQQADSS